MLRRKIIAVIIVAVFLLVFLLSKNNVSAVTQITCPINGQFTVVGPVICDPSGQPFLPKGINVFAGYTMSGFQTNLLPDASATTFIDGWKFNTLRVVTCPDQHCVTHEKNGGTTVLGDDLDQVIAKYTAKKVVVILDNHSPDTGSSTGPTTAQRQFAVQWFHDQAVKYKNNPYVWFEPFNEPNEEITGVSPDWLSFTQAVVDSVRSTGSNNILLLNTNHYGQDRWTVGGPISPSESAILTYGPQLSSQYGNIVFDVHYYSRWSGTNTTDTLGYFNTVQNKSLAILAGETWGNSAGPTYQQQDQTATDTLYATVPKAVGILPWSAAGMYPSTTTTGNALDINSLTNPTNLTHNGQLHWNWTHNPPPAIPDGYTVISASPTPSPSISPTPTSTPTPTPILPITTSYDDMVTGTGLNQFEYVGSWFTSYDPGFYQNYVHYSFTQDDYFQFRFSGTQVKLYNWAGHDTAIMAVSVDGGTETLVDTYSDPEAFQKMVYESPVLTNGNHIVKFRLTGTHNAAATAYNIVPDRIDVVSYPGPTPSPTITPTPSNSPTPTATPTATNTPTPTTTPTPTPALPPGTTSYDDTLVGTGLHQFNYVGAWAYGTSPDEYGGGDHFDNRKNDYFTFKFSGKQVKLYAPEDPNFGKAAISIDGGAETTVDLYSSTLRNTALYYTSPVLTNTIHTVKVRVTGLKRAAALATYIAIEKADVIR